ncbi:MAG: TatA/E family twin arginine-targeting protein translocase [Nitrospirota bacterium]
MFGLGFPELVLILVIALVVLGPKKLPELGRTIGKALSELKKASDSFQDSVRSEIQEVQKKSDISEIKNELNKTMLSPVDLSEPRKDDSLLKKSPKKKTREAQRHV